MLRREADNGYSPRSARESMNRALDESLDAAERDTFHAHLNRAPHDAQFWQQMRRVDRRLRSAHTLNAPIGFSARVIAALAAGREANRLNEPKREFRTSLSIAIALMIAVCTAVPLLGATLLVLLRLVSSGAFVQIAGQLRDQWLALQVTLLDLSNTLGAPNARTLALASLPTAATCGWLARQISVHTPGVTYRIPVSFVVAAPI